MIPTVVCQPLPRVQRFYLVSDYQYETVFIARGFTWDGQSVPWGLRWLAGHPHDADSLTASCVHDYLYRTGEVSKQRADAMFFEILADHGVSRWKSQMKFLALVLFGGRAWRACRSG